MCVCVFVLIVEVKFGFPRLMCYIVKASVEFTMRWNYVGHLGLLEVRRSQVSGVVKLFNCNPDPDVITPTQI
eukprot:6477359-Amphidinium_carterae.1